MKFMLNYVRNEVILLKKILSSSKLNDLDSLCEKIKLIMFDIDILKDNLKSIPKLKDYQELYS